MSDRNISVNGTPYMDRLTVRYTAKSLAGVANTETIRIGYPVAFDFANLVSKLPSPGSTGYTKPGLGFSVNKPEANNIHLPAGIISRVFGPAGAETAAEECEVEIVTVGAPIYAYVRANATAGTTFLGMVAGKWYLAAVTGVGSLAAIKTACGNALETADTSAAVENADGSVPIANLKRVLLHYSVFK